MIEFIPDFPISELSPADYNPRRIDEESFAMLRSSLLEFGIIKPALLNGNGTLIAGHQRVKGILANNGDRLPVLRTKLVGMKDEARLNLYHNSIETNASTVRISGELQAGYSWVQHSQIEVLERKKPAIVAEICRLVVKYGEWGSLIVSADGEVICNSDYAVATKNLRTKVLVYVVPVDQVERLRPILSRDYGQYNYDTLPVHNISQKRCQMHRIRGGEGKQNTSRLYEHQVIPNVRPEQRGLDFGEGYGDYRRMLVGKGYNILGYEPFQIPLGATGIDLPSIRAAIKRVEEAVEADGLFDYVVLDSVINSVTSLEFEHAVLQTCAALLASDGTFYTSTRNEPKEVANKNVRIDHRRAIEFMDEDGFSTIFRDGAWTKQRYHTPETFTVTLERYFEEIDYRSLGPNGKNVVQMVCRRPKPQPAAVWEKALDMEFNLDYNGVRLNSHRGLVAAVMLKLGNDDRIS